MRLQRERGGAENGEFSGRGLATAEQSPPLAAAGPPEADDGARSAGARVRTHSVDRLLAQPEDHLRLVDDRTYATEGFLEGRRPSASTDDPATL
jgi:hypothetical protein